DRSSYLPIADRFFLRYEEWSFLTCQGTWPLKFLSQRRYLSSAENTEFRFSLFRDFPGRVVQFICWIGVLYRGCHSKFKALPEGRKGRILFNNRRPGTDLDPFPSERGEPGEATSLSDTIFTV